MSPAPARSASPAGNYRRTICALLFFAATRPQGDESGLCAVAMAAAGGRP